ncbi:MAG: VIT domain-containing protein [Thermodesulfobacteriota bacterium]
MKIGKFIRNSVNIMTSAMAAAILFLGAMTMTGRAEAAGLLIADGGFGGVLEIREHDVNVTINNGIAVTEVTQVFLNTEQRQVEALYTFPVPKGASVADFSMWINGREMVGEVVEKERAREIYNSYKQQRRDPGLLEQVDYKTFEMRVFPINAGAEQKVRITYYQEIDIDHDQGTYVYPLATVTRRDINSKTTGRFAFNAEIKSVVPIANLASPSHKDAFVVARHSDTFAVASLESTGGSLESDVVINYDMARPVSGIDLVASRQTGDDGYFCLTVTAGKELADNESGMDYVFVLDVSGSMANDGKLVVSKNALEAFTDEIGENDRFEVMTFNVTPQVLFRELRPGTDAARGEARAFMATQQARGNTELVPAMTTAYKYSDPDRTLNVVILSDGMTEQGERQTLLRMIQSRPRNSRVFCVGIGNEVNRPLLEQMADDSGGLAAFISRGDDFQRAARGFKRKLMRPVATDLQLDFGGVKVYDVEPRVLPNLYHGSPIRVYGRYEKGGTADVRLTGNIRGVAMQQSAAMTFPDKDIDNPEIERMWAWKRVDQLLKEADRSGDQSRVVGEIVGLGETYSIVTRYTSFLVLENDEEYKRWKIERRNAGRMARDHEAQTRRKALLDQIKDKAMSDIGPQEAIQKTTVSPGKNAVQTSPSVPGQQPQAQNTPPSSGGGNSRGADFDFGGGPVGPLFAWFAFWLRRHKMKNVKNNR